VRGLRAAFQRRRFAPRQLKFIDETGMNLALTRLYGRAALDMLDENARNKKKMLTQLRIFLKKPLILLGFLNFPSLWASQLLYRPSPIPRTPLID
jgi:hypothetical protein